MIVSFLIFIGALFLVAQGAMLATKYSANVAERFNMSRYVVGFVVVACVSALPETIVAISSALTGRPEFGLATLFGSNVADLTLIFAIVTIAAGRRIKVESKMLKDIRYYPFLLMVPIFFGLNGHYSRLEGVLLLIIGILFYYKTFKMGAELEKAYHSVGRKLKDLLLLLLAIIILLVGAYFTIDAATDIATALRVTPVLIGMLVVGLGTTMPELFYSLKAVRKKEDELAIGDILGTVMTGATIVVGIVAIIEPFFFPARIVYVTGIFMIIASLFLFYLLRTGKTLTRLESFFLLAFWIIYAIIEITISKTLI